MSERGNFFRNTMILSAAATAALHAGIELAGNSGHGPRIPDADPFVTTHSHTVDMGQFVIGDNYLVTTMVPGEPSQQTSTKTVKQPIHDAPVAYARKFEHDPAAKIANHEVVMQTLSEIKEIKDAGYTPTLVVRGRSSAEDNSDDATGGVQTPSPKNENIKLADARVRAFLDDLKESGMSDDVKVVILESREDSLSDQQVAELNELVTQYGYTDVKDMIDRWNLAPNDAPPLVSSTLGHYLGGSHRSVVSRVVGTKKVTKTVPGKQVKQEECMQPVERVYRKYDSQEGDVTFPYGLFVMLGGVVLGMAGEVVEDVRRNYSRATKAHSSRSSLSAAGPSGVTGSGLSARSEVAEATLIEDTPDVEPEVSVQEEPSVPKPERRRRKWSYVIPLVGAVVAGGWALKSCDDKPAKTVPAVAPVAPPDPCHGLNPKKKQVRTRTEEYRHGVLVSSGE